MLQRRHDLIPNLVETTKGFAQQERTSSSRSPMRARRWPAPPRRREKIAAANAESSALARLLVVVENYPQLKSDQTFIRLMDELTGTENRIAAERRRYNETIAEYNTDAAQLPGQHHGEPLRLQGVPVLRGAGGRQDRAEGGLQEGQVAVPGDDMAVRDSLLPEFDQEMAATRQVLERLPEPAFAWRPHPKSYDLGGLATHLAQIPHWGSSILKHDGHDLATAGQSRPPRCTTVAAVLERFDAHVREVRAALVEMTDGQLLAPWTLRRGDASGAVGAAHRRAPRVRRASLHSPSRPDDGVPAPAGRAAAAAATGPPPTS